MRGRDTDSGREMSGERERDRFWKGVSGETERDRFWKGIVR